MTGAFGQWQATELSQKSRPACSNPILMFHSNMYTACLDRKNYNITKKNWRYNCISVLETVNSTDNIEKIFVTFTFVFVWLGSNKTRLLMKIILRNKMSSKTHVLLMTTDIWLMPISDTKSSFEIRSSVVIVIINEGWRWRDDRCPVLMARCSNNDNNMIHHEIRKITHYYKNVKVSGYISPLTLFSWLIRNTCWFFLTYFTHFEQIFWKRLTWGYFYTF
jgi:hypothetical protein